MTRHVTALFIGLTLVGAVAVGCTTTTAHRQVTLAEPVAPPPAQPALVAAPPPAPTSPYSLMPTPPAPVADAPPPVEPAPPVLPPVPAPPAALIRPVSLTAPAPPPADATAVPLFPLTHPSSPAPAEEATLLAALRLPFSFFNIGVCFNSLFTKKKPYKIDAALSIVSETAVVADSTATFAAGLAAVGAVAPAATAFSGPLMLVAAILSVAGLIALFSTAFFKCL